LRESERRFRVLAEYAADVLYTTDGRGIVTWVASSVRHALGLEPDHVVGRSGLSLVHPDDADSLRGLQRELVTSRQPMLGITASPIRFITADGGHRLMSLRVSLPEHPLDGDGPGSIVALRDVTGEVAAQRALQHQATHDPLTDLPNRAAAYDRLHRLATGRRQPGSRIAVAYCDLDMLRSLNKRHGHGVGDEALVLAAQRLQGSTRADDLVARVGGDEFLVLFDGVHDLHEAAMLADRLLQSHAQPMLIDSLVVPVTLSIGVTLLDPDESIDDCVKRADEAMFTAKDNGGARIVST
jgi:diguanylate cyclase (GGDEF)-like protein/PAS domain S-box-containing protein